MPTKLNDYECPECGDVHEVLVHTGGGEDNDTKCPKCDVPMVALTGATHTFTTIVATTLTSKKHKAGYAHKYVNRPATKTQVGAGGGVTKGGGIHSE
jgi:hypothetical protein